MENSLERSKNKSAIEIVRQNFFENEDISDENLEKNYKHLIEYYADEEGMKRRGADIPRGEMIIDLLGLAIKDTIIEIIVINNKHGQQTLLNNFKTALSKKITFANLSPYYKDLGIDVRFSMKLFSSISWLRRLKFGNDFIDEFNRIVISVANQNKHLLDDRNSEKNKDQDKLNELKFNHFLSVFNTATVIFDSLLYYWKYLPTNEQKIFKPLLKDQKLLFTVLLAYWGHDIPEDNVVSEYFFKQILKGGSEKFCYSEILIDMMKKYDNSKHPDITAYINSLSKAPASLSQKLPVQPEIIVELGKDCDKNSNGRSEVRGKYFSDTTFQKLATKGQLYIDTSREKINNYTFMSFFPLKFIKEIKSANKNNAYGKDPLWNEWEKKITDFQAILAKE